MGRGRHARTASRDQRGAIALMTGLLMVVLVGVGAFVLDFGMAYNKTQRLQSAVDAGTLAASLVYKDNTTTCPLLLVNPVLKTAAQAAAVKQAKANLPDITTGTVSLACTTAGLQVTYSATAGSGTVFASVLNGPRTIRTSRSAAATLLTTGTPIGKMRPWPVCSGVTGTLNVVVFAPLKNGSVGGAPPCGSTGPPGNWWVGQCTGQGNGIPDTIAAVSTGCAQTSYKPVPGQPTDPTALFNHLTSHCPTRAANDTCLAGDDGNSFPLTAPMWDTLVGSTYTMPVMCSPAACSSFAFSGTGQNASYPIYKFATVTLCGFNLNGTKSLKPWPTTGPCATANPNHYTTSSVISGAGFFLVISALTSSGTVPASTLRTNASTALTK